MRPHIRTTVGLGCTGPTALSAPATPSASAAYRTSAAEARKCPAWTGAGRPGTFAWPCNRTGGSFIIVKRWPEGRLRDGLYREELVRERTILRVILTEKKDAF
jgi:hypothetical protein